jgi:transposase
VYLSDFDLKQLEARNLAKLPVSEKNRLLEKMLRDLIEARERLAANSSTSSRPPSSDPPWLGPRGEAKAEETATPEVTAEEGETPSVETEPVASPPTSALAAHPDDQPETTAPKKPGRQPGAPGHSRRLTLAVTGTILHAPTHCAVCDRPLGDEAFMARTGLYVLELVTEDGSGLRGLKVRHDKHLYGESACACGHVTRTEPGRCPNEPMWKVGLSEWSLVGPQLVSLIVCLSLRMRLSRRSIQEFLHDWLEVSLSTSTINRCLHEAGRAVEPLEERLVEEVRQASLAYADETSWKEWGTLLWLWVISTATVSLYLIGSRSAELITNALGETFAGWLMTDGYKVYRQFHQRLRCWAHLLRKAKGLEESLTGEARRFGEASHALLTELMAAVYQAREGPPTSLADGYRARLEDFRALCEQHRHSRHEKTRALAGEFLNDWEAVWIVLAHPYLPLTNNEAERALRHWVILRRITQGTRTEQGSRALALLISVIETCRKRKHLPWPYLAQVIAERRKGNPAPPILAAT